MRLRNSIKTILSALLIISSVTLISFKTRNKNALEVQLTETWNIHNSINLHLLNEIPSDHLVDLSASKGRNVGEQFAHIHNNRIEWIQEIDPHAANGLKEISGSITKELLNQELTKSGIAMEKILSKSFSEGVLKNFSPHPAAFFGYLISHESHHRGQIVLSLKQAGHPLPEKVSYALWNWSSQ